jgi:hypothetical protein
MKKEKENEAKEEKNKPGFKQQLSELQGLLFDEACKLRVVKQVLDDINNVDKEGKIYGAELIIEEVEKTLTKIWRGEAP